MAKKAGSQPPSQTAIEKVVKKTQSEKINEVLAEMPELFTFLRLENSLVGEHINAVFPPDKARSNLMGLTNAALTRLTFYLEELTKQLAPPDKAEKAERGSRAEFEIRAWGALARINSLAPIIANLGAFRDRLRQEYEEHHPAQGVPSPIIYPEVATEEEWNKELALMENEALPALPVKSNVQPKSTVQATPADRNRPGNKRPV